MNSCIQRTLMMVLLSAFAGLALVLTLVGLYGVMAYSVATGRRQIGVHLALGVPGQMVFRMVLHQAAMLVCQRAGRCKWIQWWPRRYE
jgi:putative ABC transport system permease protein